MTKRTYDSIQIALAAQAKARRLAREAGQPWKTGSGEEVRYWALKEQLERMEETR